MCGDKSGGWRSVVVSVCDLAGGGWKSENTRGPQGLAREGGDGEKKKAKSNTDK